MDEGEIIPAGEYKTIIIPAPDNTYAVVSSAYNTAPNKDGKEIVTQEKIRVVRVFAFKIEYATLSRKGGDYVDGIPIFCDTDHDGRLSVHDDDGEPLQIIFVGSYDEAIKVFKTGVVITATRIEEVKDGRLYCP